jgi:LuxR family transcriptional regulator, maltose regulon positive regulatory protein
MPRGNTARGGSLHNAGSSTHPDISASDEAEEISIPILTTKLSIPPERPDWVLRARLIEQLDRASGKKLVLVSAPAGFGKTTLVASWLHSLGDREDTRVAWLSLDEDDNDPIRFLAHLIATLQTIDQGIGQTARPFLEVAHIPRLTHPMTLLINDIAALQWQSILVFDDYHVIDHAELQTSITFFLDHLPPHCHLIVTTREEPPLPLPRLRAKGEVLELRLQDLRFIGEETATFLNRTMCLALTAEAVQTLEDRTEGWVAGLQMAALSLRGQTGQTGQTGPAQTPVLNQTAWDIDAFGGGHRYVIDYLAAEVLRQQPGEFRAFLRQTAILDRFNASLCGAVTGRDDSQAMLAQLEKANLFLIPLDHERQWYRYHHLFADFLCTELTEPEQVALHCRASNWYEAQGMISEAIKHALAAHDPMEAVRLIRNYGQETLRNGGLATIRGWVNALPEEIVRAHVDMLVRKGWILYLQGEIAAAETYATLATENDRADDPPKQRGMLLNFRSYLAINRGEPEEAVKFAREALDLLDETESYHRTLALSHLGQAQRLVGDRRAAIQTLYQAIAMGQRVGNHLVTLEALAHMTTLLYQQGRLSEAISVCEQARSRYSDVRGNPLPMAGLIYVSLGFLYYEVNDLERAYHHLTTGIALCQQMGIIYPALLGQRTLARLHYARGETEAMWETLAAARRLAARTANLWRTRLVSVVTAELQLRQGQTAAAALTLADLPDTAEDRSEQENMAFVRLLLAQGHVSEAQERLREIEQVAQQEGRRGCLITIHLLQALAHRALDHEPAALERLKEAISLAAPEGYRRIFLDEDPSIAALLRERQDLAPEFAAALLEAFPKCPAPHSVTTAPEPKPDRGQPQPLIEPLSETQLMILRLVADGLSNRNIAARLEITEGTTKWHLNQIYGKLNVSSRTQAVAQARQLNLL